MFIGVVLIVLAGAKRIGIPRAVGRYALPTATRSVASLPSGSSNGSRNFRVGAARA